MGDFNFDTFIKHYEPKSLAYYLEPYTSHRKLIGYTLLENHKRSNLAPTKTYIKYIDIDKIGQEPNFNYIKTGGILMSGGIFINNKYKKIADPSAWKILKLKFDPSPCIDETGKAVENRDPRIFYISIFKYHIFYKNFENSLRDYLEAQKEKIKVELLDIKGELHK